MDKDRETTKPVSPLCTQALEQALVLSNDHLLFNIFTFLPKQDWVTCTLVCRRWRQISHERRFEHLFFVTIHTYSQDVIETGLFVWGKAVTKVRLIGPAVQVDPRYIELFLSLCPNLTVLDITTNQTVTKYPTKLRKLTLETVSNIPVDLSPLHTCTQLTCFVGYSHPTNPLPLPPGAAYHPFTGLFALPNISTLRSVCLLNYLLTAEELGVINQCTQLEVLSINTLHETADFATLTNLTRLTKLVCELACIPADLSPWRIVNLTVTDRGLHNPLTYSFLHTIPSVKKLQLPFMPPENIHARPLEGCSKLASFECKSIRWCRSLDFLKDCPELCSLRLENCYSLTDITHISTCTGLTDIEILNAPKIEKLSPLAACTGLASLTLTGVLMSAIHDFPTLSSCEKLKRISLSPITTDLIPGHFNEQTDWFWSKQLSRLRFVELCFLTLSTTHWSMRDVVMLKFVELGRKRGVKVVISRS